jgi:DNA-binding transcriptional ArsR family regulator
MPVPLSEETRLNIISLYKDGVTCSEISRLLKVGISTVSRVSKKCGFIRRERMPETKEALIGLVRLLEEEESLKALVLCGQLLEDEKEETRAQLVRIRELLVDVTMPHKPILKKEKLGKPIAPVMFVPSGKKLEQAFVDSRTRHPHVLESGK